MSVRPAKQEDLTGVIEVDKLSFSNPWDRDFLANISKTIFLVFGQQDVYGFLIAACHHREVCASLLKIAVHPEHRRKGIATNLINKLVEMLRAAISLYKKVGFKPVSTIPQASNKDDLCVMKLELT